MSESSRGRRHGEQLESAILSATWDELVDVGYARLTMRSVAARARTSEPVLYRRWPNKDALVLAALEQHRLANPVPLVDTGALRTDLLEQLAVISDSLAGFFVIVIGASLAGLLADTGLTPAQARARIMDAPHVTHVRDAYLRASERGELDLERIPQAVLDLPFDLVRHDLVMNLAPLEPERVRSIVDDLFLPLVEASGAYRPRA